MNRSTEADPNHARELLDRLCAPAGDSTPAPRTLLALAHPGDEIPGAASRLTRITAAALVYATDGSPRDGRAARAAGYASAGSYARLRQTETLRALAHAGISSERAVFLAYPHEDAAHRLLTLTADLRRWIIALRPEVVLTHAYEGGHPDRDAVAFAVHAAVAALIGEEEPAPVIVEFTSHYAADGENVSGEFLGGADFGQRQVELTEDGRALKRRLLACHRSQANHWSNLPVDTERFRLAPAYVFTQPPHERFPLYAAQGLDLTADEWCELASAASEHLGLTGQTCVLK